jgi:carotenoid cleavage dioxygenase-like enzyme
MGTAVAAPAAGATYRTPVSTEIEAFDLPVAGVLPPELCGDYIRNGPNPPPGAKAGHLFMRDGMLHGVRIANGRAQAYRNRWVRTRQFVEHAPYIGKRGALDLTVGAANTNVVAHGNRLLALVESSFPTEVTRELATTGVYDYKWSDRYGARLGIVDRNDPSAAVRWLEIEPCYVFHVLNAFEDGERIVIDVVAGWLMCYVYDAARDRSEFVVLDASGVAAPPVAAVPLPARVPLGFHGNRMPDDAAAH